MSPSSEVNSLLPITTAQGPLELLHAPYSLDFAQPFIAASNAQVYATSIIPRGALNLTGDPVPNPNERAQILEQYPMSAIMTKPAVNQHGSVMRKADDAPGAPSIKRSKTAKPLSSMQSADIPRSKVPTKQIEARGDVLRLVAGSFRFSKELEASLRAAGETEVVNLAITIEEIVSRVSDQSAIFVFHGHKLHILSKVRKTLFFVVGPRNADSDQFDPGLCPDPAASKLIAVKDADPQWAISSGVYPTSSSAGRRHTPSSGTEEVDQLDYCTMLLHNIESPQHVILRRVDAPDWRYSKAVAVWKCAQSQALNHLVRPRFLYVDYTQAKLEWLRRFLVENGGVLRWKKKLTRGSLALERLEMKFDALDHQDAEVERGPDELFHRVRRLAGEMMEQAEAVLNLLSAY